MKICYGASSRYGDPNAARSREQEGKEYVVEVLHCTWWAPVSEGGQPAHQDLYTEASIMRE